MITIGYSTRKNRPFIKEYIEKSCGIHKVEVISFENPGTHSLSEAYNIIIEKSSNDIVVLCHDDIYFEKKGWGRKIIKHFKKCPNYGILGVAGSTKLPKSGMWWENKKTMKGIVNHEHEGKKWESKYSKSTGNEVEDVVLVDGLFMVLNKKNLKSNFNEEVKGFHMYDVDFCVRNYIEGVKVGVVYDIRITHLSIGQTNEQWEENRKEFSERYKDNLPISEFDSFENRKLKILIGVLNFQGLTGSEVSTLELAKGLSMNGCDVSVISNTIGKKYESICKNYNIKTYTTTHPPGYLIGDGVKSITTPQGVFKTEKR